jgi:hypothetical protein
MLILGWFNSGREQTEIWGGVDSSDEEEGERRQISGGARSEVHQEAAANELRAGIARPKGVWKRGGCAALRCAVLCCAAMHHSLTVRLRAWA